MLMSYVFDEPEEIPCNARHGRDEEKDFALPGLHHIWQYVTM